MAGDASGDRRDETDGSREPPATDRDVSDSTDEAWNAVDSDADDRKSVTDRIPIDLSSDADDRRTDDEREEADDAYAPEPSSTPIEREEPSLENAIFVVLGALVMILVIVRIVSIPV
ncbi:DUF7312 domain-containing protein [Natronococcus wangiae]|uniref:DUF7312 domain-containing protein n=1 Tax=Natronococcus wangiae TaxID=3068275 RepID=UPI00273F7B73|nr:hypothetical protein [Natronococcus sp. AD5]